MLGGILLSSPASMSLGRPVLPPDVIDFQIGDTRSGSGASDSPGSGTKPIGTLGVTPRGSAQPTSSARGLRSRMPDNSASGSRADNGCGTAPSFQHARTASIHSMELGIATDTRSPWPTPKAAYARASRLVERS